MTRVFFARGVEGETVRRLQRRLSGLGFDTRGIDGVYGSCTQRAVQRFQKDRGLAATGSVDGPTYEALMGTAVPPVRDRALGVTARFEGHDFTLAQGNYDGAGITWGIIGFTLQHGKLKKIVLEIQQSRPELVREAFGGRTDQLLETLALPLKEQLAFADRISLGADKVRLAEPWRSSFRRFGELPDVQEVQLRIAGEDYFAPALETAKAFGLSTELGQALAFDVHVQNGGIKTAAGEQIRKALAENPVASELDRRLIIAHAVADKAKPEFREDVRSRKLTLAAGAGKVHGDLFLLRNWGLDDVAAES